MSPLSPPVPVSAFFVTNFLAVRGVVGCGVSEEGRRD